jgi:hypothetical protein
MVKMTPDDALKLRVALEPLTHPMVGEETEEDAGNMIAVASIAVSLKRVADAMEKQNKLIEALTLVHKTKR